jgi:iron complex transport system substrate-binding protein
MRIASMLSSATEIVYALGLQDRLVGISHECDWPPQALRLPRLSRSRFDPAGLSSGEIDAEVRRCMLEHGSVYEVDVEALRDVRPDVILTQAVCEVCAVPTGSVDAAVAALPWTPAVVSLDAHTLDGILATMAQVAAAAGEPARGEEAVGRLRARLDRVRAAVDGGPRPRVLALEWLDPPFAPGHWVPEMVTMAGGDNLVGEAGSHSREIPWSRAEGLDPDRLLLVPCGFAMDRARQDADEARERLRRIAPGAVDGGRAAVGDSAWFSRSGPRVVEGIEALAAWLHPDAGLAPPAGRILEGWE